MNTAFPTSTLRNKRLWFSNALCHILVRKPLLCSRPEVIASMNQAVENAKQRTGTTRIALIGYSGCCYAAKLYVVSNTPHTARERRFGKTIGFVIDLRTLKTPIF